MIRRPETDIIYENYKSRTDYKRIYGKFKKNLIRSNNNFIFINPIFVKAHTDYKRTEMKKALLIILIFTQFTTFSQTLIRKLYCYYTSVERAGVPKGEVRPWKCESPFLTRNLKKW